MQYRRRDESFKSAVSNDHGSNFIELAELVRNGRICYVTHVEIGLPGDPAGGRSNADAGAGGIRVRCMAGFHTLGALIPWTRVMPLKGL